MKKIISMILIVMLTVVCFATAGSAATLTASQVDFADQVYLASSQTSSDITVSATATGGKIKVTYSSDLLAAKANAQATIIIYDASTNATPTAGNIIQIDQFAYNSNSTVYEYKHEVEENDTIVVLMGGTDIETPGRDEVTLSQGVPGDVNSDGNVTMGDAVKIAQEAVSSGGVLTEAERLLADVTNDGNITMGDAVKVAQIAVSQG